MAAEIVRTSGDSVVVQVTVKLGTTMLDGEALIQEAVNEAGALATQHLLEKFDTNGEPIRVGSSSMSSKGKTECAYQTPYGEVVVARHVYQTCKGGKTFCPLEEKARILLSATPKFAKQLSHKYADLGASRVTGDLRENHGRQIARSFVQNVAEAVAAVAQATEEIWTYETPQQVETVASVTIGVDGTSMLTVTDGWKQAMVGTVALYSKTGERLHTIYIGATPEYGKETFHERMVNEIKHVKRLFPAALYIGVADGAPDNWSFLNEHTSVQILDFFHASEYLTAVSKAVFLPQQETARKDWLADACHRLKHNHTGPKALLKEMKEFRGKRISEEKRATLEKAITYFHNKTSEKLMNYAGHVERNLPIGSGVTEAACKLIVKQRLCCSGMRWKEAGAASVLSLRTLSYTVGRWEQFWQKVDTVGFPLAA